MAGEHNGLFRQQLWQQFSEEQIRLLKSLREELSSRRWKIMLDVDATRGLVRRLSKREQDRELAELICELAEMLDQVHRDLSRIPEDVIPAF
jgi:hypothetical protein